MLVAVAYYIGSEKGYEGGFPFIVLAFITTACMVSSEVIAKLKKRKISPEAPNAQTSQVSKLIISNLIPFTTLNLIFAFSIVISVVIRSIQKTQIGIPNISIQITVVLVCLLFSNPDAKKHFQRRSAAFRGVDLM